MERKQNYMNQLLNYCEEYRKVVIITADNVGSRQMQNIRIALRGKAVVLMGKNTLMKKTLKMNAAKYPKLQILLPQMKGNIGLVFTNEDLGDIKKIISENKVSAPARVGSISPVKVVVPAGPTGLEPTKTSFFQALQIPTKITKGVVEIINDYTLLNVGDKVGNSEATLLQMLNIHPFFYGMKLDWVYDDGAFFQASVLDITDERLGQSFRQAANNVAAVSLVTGIPSEAAIPHVVVNAFKDLLAVSIGTSYEIAQAADIKQYLANPSAFAAAAPAAAAPAAAAPAKKEEAKKESESEEGMGMDLFG